ncbi:hypothetical protein [uncultured Jannaschia sp.]|uniref:porin n=1 Tax=uncultured Jannaschia sp. TaxID=293347 RepID=UPI0026297755|nr:hypothetical protein [uncultured Jannaschia sp.]
MIRTLILLGLSLAAAGPATAQTRLSAMRTDTGAAAADAAGVTFSFGGQINPMVLHAEQGPRDRTFLADNDGSGSRLEFRAEGRMGPDLTAGLELVLSAETHSSDGIGFGSQDRNGDAGDPRQAHVFVEGDRFGTLSVGKGDTAAEDAAHADLSGTDFAGSESDVDDVAGGLHFRDASGRDLGRLDGFFDMQDGDRALRVRYDTPDRNGVSFGISAAEGDDGDGLDPAVTFRYEGETGFGEVAAALAYRRAGRADDRTDAFWVGSASVLLPSGFNATVAASRGDIAGQGEAPTAMFLKLGYLRDHFGIGETRVSVDHFRGEANAAFGGPGGDLVEAGSWGFFAVQEIADLNTEAYLGFRRYELDDVFVNDTRGEVDALNAVLVGARVRF